MADSAIDFSDIIPQTPGGGPQSAVDFSDVTPAYRGSVLPFSADASGTPRLDWSAGLPGMITNALKAPGDVYSGKLPVFSPNGSFNPAMTQQARALAGLINPDALPAVSAPSAQQLVDYGSRGYNGVRATGLQYPGASVSGWARGTADNMTFPPTGGKTILPVNAPQTYGYLNELSNPPPTPPGGNVYSSIGALDAARQAFQDIGQEGKGSDTAAAKRVVGSLDDFMSTPSNAVLPPGYTGTATPQDITQGLTDARGNYAAAMRSNALTGDLDRANTGLLDRAQASASSANSGENFDNALRQRIKAFAQQNKNVAGFTDDEIDALNQQVDGGNVQNALRWIGNKMGGHTMMAAGGGIGSYLGFHAGGEYGGAAGAMVGGAIPAAIRAASKSLENAMARRNFMALDEATRLRSPLGQQMQQQGLLTPGGPQMPIRAAPGLLSPQQQPMSYSWPPQQPQQITPEQLQLLRAGGA